MVSREVVRKSIKKYMTIRVGRTHFQHLKPTILDGIPICVVLGGRVVSGANMNQTCAASAMKLMIAAAGCISLTIVSLKHVDFI